MKEQIIAKYVTTAKISLALWFLAFHSFQWAQETVLNVWAAIVLLVCAYLIVKCVYQVVSLLLFILNFFVKNTNPKRN